MKDILLTNVSTSPKKQKQKTNPKQQQKPTNNTNNTPMKTQTNQKKKRNSKSHKKPPNKKLQQLCNKEDLDEVEIPYSKLHAVSLHSKVFHWKEATVLIHWVASNQKANITASSK